MPRTSLAWAELGKLVAAAAAAKEEPCHKTVEALLEWAHIFAHLILWPFSGFVLLMKRKNGGGNFSIFILVSNFRTEASPEESGFKSPVCGNFHQ